MRRLHTLVITFFIAACSLFSQSSGELITSGIGNLRMKRFKEAVQDFSEYLLVDRDNLTANLGRADAYFNLADWENAIVDFNNAELVSPGSGNLGLARVYAQIGNASMAVDYLEKHLQSELRVPEKEIVLDKAFEPIESTSEWRALWRKNWYPENEQIIREVEYLIGKGTFDEALEMLNDLALQEPENADCYHLRAKIFTAQNENKKALTNCDIALRYKKDNLEYLLTRSDILVDLKRYEEALKPLDRAIYLNPVQIDLYPKRAVVYEQAGDLNSAVKDIDYYLGFIENDKEALFISGQLNRKMGKLYPALESFNKLIALDQGNPVYFISRGKAFFDSGRNRYAIADFGMALDLDPSNSEAYLFRGKAYLVIEELEQACYDFEKAAERGNKEAADLLYRNCR